MSAIDPKVLELLAHDKCDVCEGCKPRRCLQNSIYAWLKACRVIFSEGPKNHTLKLTLLSAIDPKVLELLAHDRCDVCEGCKPRRRLQNSIYALVKACRVLFSEGPNNRTLKLTLRTVL